MAHDPEVVGLALALLLAAPAHDLRSAAERLAPPGAHVTLAYEQDARFGVAAYADGTTTTVRAFRWRDGRWQTARAGSVRIQPLAPSPGARLHEPALARIRFRLGGGLGASTVWIDGRRATADSFAARGPRTDAYFVLRGQSHGVHRVIAFAEGGDYATARTWTYTVL